MRKRTLPALALAALLLTACTGGTPAPAAPAATEAPTPPPEPAASVAEEPAATPEPAAAVQWAVEPTIEADTIDVLRLARGSANQQDYNAFAMHKDDGLCMISQGGRQGLIDYDGNLVVPAEYDTIELGMDGRYILSNGGGEYEGGASWTLQKDQPVSLSGVSMADTVGTAPNRVLYWVPERDSLYISGGVDTWLEAVYTAATPCAGWVVTQIEYDCATAWDGYVLTDGTRPVSDTRYEAAGAFNSGLIPLQQDGKWGYLNAQGATVLPFAFDAGWQNATPDGPLPYAATEGCVVVCREGQYALYDVTGNCLIDFGQYEALRPVHDGKLWARQNGKWGVLQLTTPPTLPDNARFPAAGVAVAPDTADTGVAMADSDAGLVLRAGPGTEYDRLGLVPYGCRLWVSGASSTVEGWVYVDQGGWVSAEYLLRS